MTPHVALKTRPLTGLCTCLGVLLMAACSDSQFDGCEVSRSCPKTDSGGGAGAPGAVDDDAGGAGAVGQAGAPGDLGREQGGGARPTGKTPGTTGSGGSGMGGASHGEAGAMAVGTGGEAGAAGAAPLPECEPSGPEVCDGIDNDCNGLADVADGLPLSDEPAYLGTRIYDFDWSPVREDFAVLTDAALIHASPTGAWKSDLTSLDDPLSGAVSWGTDRFAIVVVGGAPDPARALFFTKNAGSGVSSSVDLGEANHADVAPFGEGDWLVVTQRTLGDSPGVPSAAMATRLSSEGERRGSLLLFGDAQGSLPRLAAHPSVAAAVWNTPSNEVKMALMIPSSDPEPGVTLRAEALLSGIGGRAHVASIEGGFVFAWATPAGFALEMRDLDGKRGCGPSIVQFGDGLLTEADEVVLTNTPDGIVALAVDASGEQASLFRFSGACELAGAPAPLPEPVTQPHSPRLATGSLGVGVSWGQQNSAGDPVSGSMVLKTSFCE